jgi:hypothetical protein
VSADDNSSPHPSSRPGIFWVTAILGVGFGAVQIARGSALNALLVFTLIVISGWLFYLGDKAKQRRRRRVVLVVLSVLFAAGGLLAAALSDVGNDTHSPPLPNTRSTTPTSTPSLPTTVGSAALPPRPYEEKEVVRNAVAEFFDRELIVAGETGGVYAAVRLTLTTRESSCKSIGFDLGDVKIVGGRRGNETEFLSSNAAEG